ncbi:MAG: hypothetical protein ACRDRZ_10530 [Pseudonocardiaceae bacterium]
MGSRSMYGVTISGVKGIAGDVLPPACASGWSRTTVYTRLDAWVDQSRLVRVDDGWLPVLAAAPV